jgi:Raf kinase inhibitor-like YbhB/YbcL family protein
MRSALAVALAALLLAGCTGTSPSPSTTTSETPVAMTLSSPAFANGGTIPEKHTCDGAQVSPPITIDGVPRGAASLALTMKDPDVPTPQAPVRTLNHWVAWNLTPAAGAVVFPEGGVPVGGKQGANDFGNGYLGPCPPPASPAHHYNLTAYALDTWPSLPANATAAQLDAAMAGHIVAKATLIGLYARKTTA